jgi:hypothetical protein
MDRPYSAVLADRIDEVLADGTLSTTDIVRRLNDDADEDGQRVKIDSVRAALRRGLKATPKRYAVAGSGDSSTWSRA